MQPIRTRLTRLLGIPSPIVAPPMGGASGGELAGQVILGGGYGFAAAGWGDAASFAKELEIARGLLNVPADAPLPIGVGCLGWLLDKSAKTAEPLRVALEHQVQSIWLSFGVNLDKWVDYVREYDSKRSTPHKTLVWIVISSLAEARNAVDVLKADVLVVQGIEAGGHGSSTALPLSSLLAVVRDAIPDGPPVVAAGGIVTGTQAAGLLVMGADGVALGTRFLATTESTYTKNQKQAVVEATTTVRTDVFDAVRGTDNWPEGVDGRGIPNVTLEEASAGLPFEERKKRFVEGVKNDDTSRTIVWSGSSVGLVKEVKGAKALAEDIRKDVVLALNRASQLLEA